MTTAEEILNRALELPMDERADLVHKLLLSLEPEPPDPDWEAAWAEEIERRLGQLDRGEVQTRDAWEALAEIRQALQDRKKS
jgi:putative addiction module component (TIGR02574 family)